MNSIMFSLNVKYLLKNVYRQFGLGDLIKQSLHSRETPENTQRNYTVFCKERDNAWKTKREDQIPYFSRKALVSSCHFFTMRTLEKTGRLIKHGICG